MNQPPIQEQTRFDMKGRTVIRRIGEDRLLVPISGQASQRNSIFPCNQTGLRMWEELTSGKSPEEVADRLEQEFDASREELQSDCLEFAQLLMDEELLCPEEAQ